MIMITNFKNFASQIEKLSPIVGASKSSDIVGTKFKSLLSISGDIQLGVDFKASLNAEQLTKFGWLKDDDLTIRSGVITVEGLDNKPRAYWLNTAILAQLSKAGCLTVDGDIKPEVKGIAGEFHTDSVIFAKGAVKEKEEVEEEELTNEFILSLTKPKIVALLENNNVLFDKSQTLNQLKQLAIENLV